ncbi:(d)CMP kinase, partial [Mycobacterium tuberculosis]|nr:(d)CMP kinase [Mycobacterium tuberculosis]
LPRTVAGGPGSIDAEGRDIGTGGFPDGPVEIFWTSAADTRARRRIAQSVEAPQPAACVGVFVLLAPPTPQISTRAVSP